MGLRTCVHACTHIPGLHNAILSHDSVHQDHCFLQVLQQAVGGHDAALLVQVLRSVQPDSNQQDKVGIRQWSCACLAAVLPGAVRLLHKLLAPSQAAQLSANQLQVTVHFSTHAMGQAY